MAVVVLAQSSNVDSWQVLSLDVINLGARRPLVLHSRILQNPLQT